MQTGYRSFSYETYTYNYPLASGKVENTDITAIKKRSNNLFFITAGEKWIVIDAGSNSKAVQAELERLSNATIYMNEQEKQMIDGSTVTALFYHEERFKYNFCN